MAAFKKTVVLSALGSAIMVVAVNYQMLMVGNLVLGLGVGGEISLGGTVFTEFCPPKELKYLTVLAAYWGAGGTLAALIALLVDLNNATGVSQWRVMVGTGVIIEVFLAVFRQ